MKRINLHSVPSIRFRRWSRKAYAVFLSLGRCVTIGHVSKSITEASLSKNRKEIGCQSEERVRMASGRNFESPPGEEDIGFMSPLLAILLCWSHNAFSVLCRPQVSCPYASEEINHIINNFKNAVSHRNALMVWLWGAAFFIHKQANILW